MNGFLLIVELVFVAANATKLLDGGWFPLLMACVVAFLMLTWRTGYQLLEQQVSLKFFLSYAYCFTVPLPNIL